VSTWLRHRQRAQVIGIVPGLILALLFVGGIAYDLGRLYTARQDLQNLAEATATAAASCYCIDPTSGYPTDPVVAATQIFDAQKSNLPDGMCTPHLDNVTATPVATTRPTTKYPDGTPLPDQFYTVSDRADATVSCNDWHPTILSLVPGMGANFGAVSHVTAAADWTWFVVAPDPNPEAVQVIAHPVPAGS
jgi:hypothetical protein